MIYHITHNTTYHYATPAEACHNLVRLDPRTIAGQQPLEMELYVEPAPIRVHTYVDYFGNRVRSFAVLQPHQRLSITSKSQVAVDRPSAGRLAASRDWREVQRICAANATTSRSMPYSMSSIRSTCAGAALAQYALASFSKGRPLLEAVFDLTARVHKDFAYDPAATTVDTPMEEVLQKRRGVCQDFAHLQIGCLKSLGLAARLRERLPADRQPTWPAAIGRRRRVARLDQCLLPAKRLDRFRPDQWLPGGRPPHHAGLGPRLSRRQPDQGRRPRRRRLDVARRRGSQSDRTERNRRVSGRHRPYAFKLTDVVLRYLRVVVVITPRGKCFEPPRHGEHRDFSRPSPPLGRFRVKPLSHLGPLPRRERRGR